MTGSSGSKSSSTNSKSSSTGNKSSSSVSSKSSSSGNKASSGTSSKVSSTANKTSATVSSKTVSSNVSKVNSTSKQTTTTKYVTNAPAIYNSSGAKVSGTSSVSTGRPAQSYATQAKTTVTNSQKSAKTTATVKTTTVKTTAAKAKTVASSSGKSTTPSSVSTGRPARSYATQAKTMAASNQKTSSNKTLIGSPNRTTNGAISTGRPKQSYISQPKTSTAKGKTTAQTKLPVPVAQKAPLVTKTSTPKKDPSEASYSNNRPQKSYTHVVAYTPTASREGAGQMFYMSRTNPTGAKEGASFGMSLIPYVGDAKDIQEAVTGKDLITGKKLTGGDRALTITAAVLPVVSGPMLKGAAKGGKIAVKEAPGAIKKAGTLIKKNAPEVKKAVKNSDVAKDTAKVLKEKEAKKLGNIVETASKSSKSSIKPVKPYEVTTYEDFRKRSVPGDGLEGHEMWQHANLNENGYATTRLSTDASKNNPAMALPHDVHADVNNAQRLLDARAQTPIENINSNAQILYNHKQVPNFAVDKMLNDTLSHYNSLKGR